MLRASQAGPNTQLSGTTNGVYIPAGLGAISAIPFIHLSSGSVAAAGAISGITALPQVYTDAYCWFPANALATTIAAGWYYCTFSGTAAGTAFLNTYTSGAPVIPASPTAVSDGRGAFTSDAASHNGPTLTLAGNSLGINGRLRIQLAAAYTNSAGTKTINPSFGGTAFTTLNAASTSLFANIELVVANRGAANKQQGNAAGVNGAGAVQAVAAALSSIDTTTAQTLTIPLAKNTAADNLILDRYSVEVMFSS